ncbi:MAG: YggS family pyridoxal phosphate-dependent enzyme [Clostridia bacterium]
MMSIFENTKNLIDEVNSMSNDVLIVAASKMRTVDEIEECKRGGIEVFAENRVQEFVDKVDLTDVKWHFVGQLQTNKVKYLVGRVELIHSVDSEKLADEISKIARKKNVTQEILIEINIGGEETKGGVSEANFDNLYLHCQNLPNVKVVGIMSVMPKSASTKLYLRIKEIYDKIRIENKDIKYLSVGMSGDYQRAIEYGANVIRIGTKIFGARRQKE